MRTIRVVMGILLSLVFAGCSAAGSDDDPYGENDLNSSIYNLLGNDFTGNSVRIHGTRSTLADRKYPCVNEFDVCLGTDPNGVTPAVRDLCPSDDTPNGTWSFSFVIYGDTTCTTPLGNLGCMPVTGEWLHPGHNHNEVICLTRNGDKDFDFCVMDPVTGAGSEACPPCLPDQGPDPTCNPV